MIAVARVRRVRRTGWAREGQPRCASERAQRVQLATGSEQIAAIVSRA
jgi:hypothetical protein